MNIEVSTDPKTVKMFRRLERFLDAEALKVRKGIHFQNAETGRVFGVFFPPDHFDSLLAHLEYLEDELDSANATISALEDESTLLGIIDAQNDVLQGRVTVAEIVADEDGVTRWIR